MHLDAEKEMMSQCVALLGKFIAVREPNIRYLGLVSYGNIITQFSFNGLVSNSSKYVHMCQIRVVTYNLMIYL